MLPSIKTLLENLGLKNKILYQTSSPISGEIKVLQIGHTKRMLIGGMTQSVFGSKSEMKVWRSIPPKGSISSCLILGLGAGTLIPELRKKHPTIKIVGYENDSVVLEVAKRYFGLDHRVEARLIDAKKDWPHENFDLIIDDLFQGRQVPSFVSSKEFLTKVQSHLNPGGLAVFNYITKFKSQDEINTLEKNLREVFKDYSTKKIRINTLYWVKNKN